MQQTKSKLRRCMVVYIFKLRWVLIMKGVYFDLCVLTPIRSNTSSSCICVYLCLCHYIVTPKSSKLMENNAMICVSTCTPFFFTYLMPIRIAKNPDHLCQVQCCLTSRLLSNRGKFELAFFRMVTRSTCYKAMELYMILSSSI